MGKIEQVQEEIEQEVASRRRFLPIVGPAKGKLLFTVTWLAKPARILELGTLVGYSAMWLRRAAPLARIDTVEIDPEIAKEAAFNFQRAGVKGVRVLVGDALKVVPKLKQKYDMVFIDIAKEDYVPAVKVSLSLLKKGGLLVADNASWNEVRPYREFVLGRKDLESILIPIGDGQMVSLKVR